MIIETTRKSEEVKSAASCTQKIDSPPPAGSREELAETARVVGNHPGLSSQIQREE